MADGENAAATIAAVSARLAVDREGLDDGAVMAAAIAMAAATTDGDRTVPDIAAA